MVLALTGLSGHLFFTQMTTRSADIVSSASNQRSWLILLAISGHGIYVSDGPCGSGKQVACLHNVNEYSHHDIQSLLVIL